MACHDRSHRLHFVACTWGDNSPLFIARLGLSSATLISDSHQRLSSAVMASHDPTFPLSDTQFQESAARIEESATHCERLASATFSAFTAARVGAISHFVPHFRPFFAPGERATADGAHFLREMFFFNAFHRKNLFLNL